MEFYESLDVWKGRDESSEVKAEEQNNENNEKKQENKSIEQVRRECLSIIASHITIFVNNNFPEFNHKLEFNESSSDITGEFTNKVMKFLNELEESYPNMKDIISEYKDSVIYEINNLSNQLKSVTSFTNLFEIVSVFEKAEKLRIGNNRTFYPSYV